MAVDSVLQLLSALASEDFDRLVGSHEGHEVDFKRAPYRVSELKERWELAKDVAALANAAGGCIVVGPQTEQHEHEVVEAVTKVSLVPKHLVSVPHYRDVVAAWVYPSPQGIEFGWYPENGDKGVLVIRVPPAGDRDRPLLLRRMVTSEGDEIPTVAIPRRNQDRTEWDPPERIHHALATARLGDKHLVSALQRGQREQTLATADERAKELRSFAGWGEEPALILQARAPDGTDLLRDLYGDGGITGAARSWKGIRRSGFDLETSAEPQCIDDLLVLGSSRWKAIINPSGWFEFILPADWDFLGWAMSKSETEPPPHVRVNSVALVEVVYDYFRFLNEVLAPRALPGSWHIWVRGVGLQSAGVEVHRGFVQRMWWDEPEKASSDSWSKDFHAVGDPAQDAFEALWRFYALWQIDQTGIPFTTDGRVDPQQILDLRNQR